MYKFFFLAFFLFMNTTSFAQEFLEKRQAPKELTQNETLPLLEQWKEEGVSFEKWDSYFQNQVDVSNFSKDWHFEDLQYRIHIDENGKVLTIDILNPSVHEQINVKATYILNSIKSLTIIPATKLGKNVAFTLEGYLLFDMCKCAYGEEDKIKFEEVQEPTQFIEPEIYIMVEEMPIFGVCKGNFEEKYSCSNANVDAYIKSELSKYTFEDEGKVFIMLIINENGLVEPKVYKSVSNELDSIALKIFENMPPWQAGKQRGKFVKVKMVFTVSFRNF